jgi:hypothetical protein
MRRENFQDRNRGFPILRRRGSMLEKIKLIVIDLLLELCFLISWKKLEVIPSQDFVFLGEHFRTDWVLCFLQRDQRSYG